MYDPRLYLPKGTILKNRYTLVGVIGAGGFGITYQAVDQLLNCYVAVKEFFPREWVGRDSEVSCEMRLPAEPEQRRKVENCRENFRREGKILRAVRDVPYVVRLRDRFEENGTEYIVLNLIQGMSLQEYAKKRGGTLPAEEVLALFQYTLDTLTELHKRGILHRDISPGNLILSEDKVLCLIDFGSATSFDRTSELWNSQVFAHKGLAAPEYSDPMRQGPWTDIFALCATIVYLTVGEGIVEAKERQDFDYLPQLLLRSALTSRQQNALLKGLNPDISRRFSDVGQLHAELYGEAIEKKLPEEWRVFYHTKTDIGTRKVNQDNYMLDIVSCYKGEDCEQNGVMVCRPEEIHIAAVCDGVGGACHGELAAKTAIQALIHFVEAHPTSDVLPDRMLEELLDQINEKVLQLGEKIGRTATTLSMFLWRGDRYYAVNIGDSPIYLLRGRQLKRISTSHTKAELHIMTQQPVMREDWNTLMQYLGKEGAAGSQMAAFHYGRLQKGDTVLVCSDGITKKNEENRLKRCLAKRNQRVMPALFRAIGKSAQNDNCTAIVLKF